MAAGLNFGPPAAARPPIGETSIATIKSYSHRSLWFIYFNILLNYFSLVEVIC